MYKLPENIKFLILKWRSGSLSESEQQILDEWYDENLPEHLEWYGDSEDTLAKRMFSQIEAQIDDETIVVPHRFRFGKLITGLSAVAVVFIFFLLSGYFTNESNIADTKLTAENIKDNVTKIILPDQSIVWLKGESKLIYPKTFSSNTREVELIGEGLFEVAKNKEKPFVVHAGDYKTTVLGTSFNLKVDPVDSKLDLSVLTGKVEVSKKKKGLVQAEMKIVVQANESFHTSKENTERPDVTLPIESVASLTKGTEYDMNFVAVPVEEIMQRFEHKFNVVFEGYTGEYRSCKVTANLTDQSLETSLKLLSLSINAGYQIKDNTIKLTGGGCF